MKIKNKPIIDTYDPVIYPVLLVVAKDVTIERLNKEYMLPDESDITEEYLGSNYCCVTFHASRRADKRKVIIVYKNNGVHRLDDLPLLDATHEGGHYVIDTFNEVGAVIDPNNQEPFCYLLQWAADCIYKTLTKKNNGNKRKKQKAI